MNTELNCPIISNEKFSKEVLSDLVTSLEQLEMIKATIFNRLNTAFQERVTRLCDIKSRIIWCNKVISSFSTINDAITLKSKYHYPNQKHNYYIPTVIDKNATKVNEEPIPKINKKVLNDKNTLGTKPTATKDRMAIYDNYLEYATQFNDVVNELNKQEISVRQTMDELEPILTNTTSNFSFGTKMKIEYAKKNQFNIQELNKNAEILKEIEEEKKEKEEQERKRIQQAPESILKKERIKKKKKKKLLKSTNNPTKIQFNLPSKIGLIGVSTIGEIEEEKNEDQNEDEEMEEEDDEDDMNDMNDDNQNEMINEEDDFNMPIDQIRQKKKIILILTLINPPKLIITALQYQTLVIITNQN